MTRDTAALTKLAKAMDERRVDLRMKWGEIASAAGISPAFLRKYRAGEIGASDITKANLEDVLQWPKGTIGAIEAGQTPPAAPPPTLRPTPGTRTLADVLIERGIRTRAEIAPSDHIVDPLVEELLASTSFPDDFKDRWLASYSVMRRELHEATMEAKKKPRDR